MTRIGFIGLGNMGSPMAANQARAEFRRDLAAAKVCKGDAFEWDGNVLTCFKEVHP